jgi:hypothetical protein
MVFWSKLENVADVALKTDHGDGGLQYPVAPKTGRTDTLASTQLASVSGGSSYERVCVSTVHEVNACVDRRRQW